ncbi:outer membrane beta-barrel protein [Bradyrhizobium sp.]|uniref:outer membrane beta-barrel protein n=1 Tax=Bradyrhizobium sp. TaxID=376 RepID=UPI0025BAD745|nr:outer membrane beta-barrel protein [Bradyrhizobium sp.]
MLLPCVALIAPPVAIRAQSLTSDLFRPERDGFLQPQNSPLRRTAGIDDPSPPDPGRDVRRSDGDLRGTSRTGAVPSYGLPAASSAADTGYDSFNRTRKKPKYYPAQDRPKPPPGPGSPPPDAPRPNLSGQLRLSIPPSEAANRPPVAPAMAGNVPGQPPRKRLRTDDDPFGAVGDYAGSFLVKSAVEVSGGYGTNPARLNAPRGLATYVVAPEFLAVSDWERHALVADLRGSFTGYGGSLPATIDGAPNPAPTDIDRPDFTGHIDGRLDVSRDLRLTAQTRLHVATDNPGSPNIQAGLARYPLATSFGGTAGFDQNFNRLQVSAGGTIDRTTYQQSKLTDGTFSSNDDRNFNQYGGVGRISYEVTPGVKPFAEIEGDSRVHDQKFDRSGFERDSSGGYAKAGTSFELTRLLTGEVSIGYAARNYIDPRLNRLEGFLTAGSLVWQVSGLTTARFNADTQVAETTLPGASGVLVHTYTVEVDHDFRRWLTAIGKFSYGTLDYQGFGRTDRTWSAEGDLIHKLTRNLWIKGTLRHDMLQSNEVGSSSAATVVMLGVRLQN